MDYTITIDLNGRTGKLIIPEDATKGELGLIQNMLNRCIEERIAHAKRIEVAKNPLMADIEDLGISVRLKAILTRSGCRTVADVLAHSTDELMGIRNMGRASYEECLKVFRQYGEFRHEE